MRQSERRFIQGDRPEAGAELAMTGRAAGDEPVRRLANADRYAVGVTPKMLRKRALKVDRSPNPLSSAIDKTESDEPAKPTAALRILAVSRYW